MRIELAKLLLQEANDVLLLDEPTNHLDISIIWLESFKELSWSRRNCFAR